MRPCIAPSAGTIALPGGFMEGRGKDVEAAVAREVQEETCR